MPADVDDDTRRLAPVIRGRTQRGLAEMKQALEADGERGGSTA